MSAKRVLLIGWDAADWQIILPLVKKGEMPNLANLMRSGIHGNLATLHPMFSPMLWTSIATGKRPPKHGILGFIEPTPDGRNVRPITSLARKTKALWNILHQNEKRSAVIGWWPSHPAEPIRGVMVSDQFHKGLDVLPAPPLSQTAVHPKEWGERLAELRVVPTELEGEILRLFVPAFEKVDQGTDKTLHHLAKVIAETMSVHGAATEVLAAEPWDFAAVYYEGLDHFSHGFMRFHPPQLPWVSAEEFESYQGVIANAYRYHDAMLGRLLQLAGPEAHVMLISDHGFHSDHRRIPYIPPEMAGAAREHRHFGIFCLSGPGVKANETLYGATLLDIAPTVLHLFGLPVGEDMDGRPLINALHDFPPPISIASWDKIPGDAGQHPPDVKVDPLHDAAAMKQLVDLGYISSPGEDETERVEDCLFELRFNLVMAHMDAGRADLAEPILTELHQARPEDIRMVERLVECRLAGGHYLECRSLLDQFDDRCEKTAPIAKTELERRIAERPTEELDPRARPPEQCELRERKRLAEKATAYIMRRGVLRMRVALACGEKGQALRYLGNLENLARATHDDTLFQLVAGTSWQAGDEAMTLRCCQEILALVPDSWEAWGLLARVHHRAGRSEEAFSAALESVSLIYHQPIQHFILGECLQKDGKEAEAEKSFRLAIQQMPGLVPALEALERLHRQQGRETEAAAIQERVQRAKAAAAKKEAPRDGMIQTSTEASEG